MDDPNAAPLKRMKLRYTGVCRGCGVALPAGTDAVYDRLHRQVACLDCAGFSTTVVGGGAGASARREHDRRVAKRADRIRDAHPRLGGLILAVTDEPQSTRAWARGAVGEEKLARTLEPLAERGVRVLHDRRIPGTRANIDHLLVGPAGVFVVDAKRYAGRPRLKVEGGLLRRRTRTLMVGRRDCTRLVTGVHKQVDLVRAVLDRGGYGALPVQGMLCFVDADWPLAGGSFIISGVHVLWPKKIAEHVLRPDTVTAEHIAAAHRLLGKTFPRA